MSLYRNILKQALAITWRYKYLWFFGLFATLIGGGGEYEVITKGIGGDTALNVFPNFSRLAETGIFSRNGLANMGELFKNDPATAAVLALISLIILVLFIFLVWLVIVSQTALVNNSAEIISGKKNSVSGIKRGVAAGIKYFWPVLGLNIVIKAIICLAFFLISLPIILWTARISQTINSPLYIILFIIFFPLAIILSFIMKYAICYVIIRGSNLANAIKDGWRLFLKNWLISVEMAFILFFISFLAGLAVIIAVLILAVPFLFLALILYKLISFIGFWLIIMIGLIVLLAIIIGAGAALTTFQTASWTGLFIELIGRGGTSKIERVAENWKK
ncbi:MAG: hypothetical protein PHQ42_04465 [Patescibacteria group bacterium]|nr:hypothetical protein [Patescibacteria group bacterium]